MRALEYALRQGWSSLWRARGASLLAIVASALALIVLGSLLLLTWNVERLIAQWSAAAEFSIYLRDDATSEQRGAIETLIDRSDVIAGRQYISKTEALARFRHTFADLAIFTDGFDDNPFPASVEVQVRPDAGRDGRADELVRRLASLPGVADVRYDGDWLALATTGLRTIRSVGFGFALLMGMAASITVAAVVRLGLHARRDELEIMELVGAPFAFIRGPFVAEGLFQGGLGAVLALLCLWLGFTAAVSWWGSSMDAILEGGSLAFLPARLCAALVAGGMVVGGAGGFMAARHAAPATVADAAPLPDEEL